MTIAVAETAAMKVRNDGRRANSVIAISRVGGKNPSKTRVRRLRNGMSVKNAAMMMMPAKKSRSAIMMTAAAMK